MNKCSSLTLSMQKSYKIMAKKKLKKGNTRKANKRQRNCTGVSQWEFAVAIRCVPLERERVRCISQIYLSGL